MGGKARRDERLRERILELYEENSKKSEKFGYRRICDLLRATAEFCGINHKRVYRVMREMGLQGYISKNGNRNFIAIIPI